MIQHPRPKTVGAVTPICYMGIGLTRSTKPHHISLKTLGHRIVLIFFLCVGTIYALSVWRETQVEKSLPVIGEIVSLNGSDVHVVKVGHGPPLMFIHGSGGNIRDISTSILPGLAEHFTVYVYDRAGHGHTHSPASQTLDDQGDLAIAVADHFELDEFYLAGHSFGGSIALNVAVRFSDRIKGLIPIGAPASPFKSKGQLRYKLSNAPVIGYPFSHLLAALVPEALVTRYTRDVFSPDPLPDGYIKNVGARFALRAASQVAIAFQRETLSNDLELIANKYKELTLPVLVMYGANDTTVPPAIHVTFMERELPNAQIILFDETGHMPHHSKSKEIVENIHTFVSSIEEAPAQ